MATDTQEQQQTAGPEPAARPQRGRQRQQRRRFVRRRTRKRCAFCEDKALRIDYKKVDLLQNYLTERGKILPRRATGACARHQRELALAIKRARHLALLPFVTEHIRTS
ncbi:MAG: hypothetical protein AMJ93_15780 [Anaerolineae bacterium SM23_84]|nr:MAG: hypothetical protein AMJ93_15780 [Anaerolineae bacterium SM23_84]